MTATLFGEILFIIGFIFGIAGIFLGPAWRGDPYAWAPPIRYIFAACLIGTAVTFFSYSYAFMTVEDRIHVEELK